METPVSGAGYLLQGFKLIWKPGVKRYVFIPLLINILVFATAITGLVNSFDSMMAWVLAKLPSWEWLAWLAQFIWILAALAVMIIVFYTFTLVANIIAAPFNSFLSGKVQLHLTGKEPQLNETLAEEVKRSIRSELIKLFYMISRALPAAVIILILSFIPLLTVFTPVLWFILSAYLLSLEYLDYSTGNNGGVFINTRRLCKQHRSSSLGFGAMVTLATSIPLLNLFVMPAAVAGGTAFWLQKETSK